MILSDGMIRSPLEWIIVGVFALFLCSVGGIIIGGLISFADWIFKGGYRNAGKVKKAEEDDGDSGETP